MAGKLDDGWLAAGEWGTGGEAEEQQVLSFLMDWQGLASPFVVFLTFLSTFHLHMLDLLPKERSLRVIEIYHR